MTGVAAQSFEQRLGEVLTRTAGKVGPEVAQQLRELVQPRSLAIMAGVLVAWVVSHGFAVGELFDIVVGVLGVIAIGTAVFSGLDELFEFARGTYYARTETDLESASRHLAKAIGILGIQVVLAVLFRRRPVTKRVSPGEAPTPTPGRRYSPSTRVDPALPVGSAYCSWWGDIYLNSISTGTEQAMLLFHERVHQILTPKLYLLRNVRVEMRVGGYTGSSLYRFLEEWLAYAVGHGRVKEWQAMFASIAFPVQRGYVYWVREGSNPALAVWGGRGIIPEGAGLIATGLVLGERMQLWFRPGPPPLAHPTGSDRGKPVPLSTRPITR